MGKSTARVVALAVVTLVLCHGATATLRAAQRDCREYPWPYQAAALRLGETLTAPAVLATATATLGFTSGGDLVVTRVEDGAQLWRSGTTGGQTLQLTEKGELVILDARGISIWNAGQAPGNASIAVLQDDCNFVMYTRAPLTNATWATNTQMCVVAHIVMHSHDDVGWLLTPERYYDGCHYEFGGVQNIIGTGVAALAMNRTRKMIQVEQYFFHRWWTRQTPEVQQVAMDLVERGQLQFVNGGWSMHDEACVHHESAVSNMEAGAQFLDKIFGGTVNLTIGWHIDPFGHASATPRLMSQMGFDAFFFWRTDYQHRDLMEQTKTFETMWSSSPSLGDPVLMFTSILYESYCMGCMSGQNSGFNMCPSPFCCMSCELMEEGPGDWETAFRTFRTMAHRHQQTSIRDLRRTFHVSESETSTLRLQDIASSYAAWIKQYAGGFRTQHVMMPWGCDFQHINAPVSFQFMDDVMAEINSNPQYGVKLHYSTPAEYVSAVAAANYAWPVNEHDYFLDSDNGHAYWSGYFSSRAQFKGFERMLMNERSSIEVALSAIPARAANRTAQLERMDVLRQALGIAQHHDSITGTEREHVRDRYQYLLVEGWDAADAALTDAIASTTGGAVVARCPLLNLSSCPAMDAVASGNVSLFVVNALAWQRIEILTIPMPVATISATVRFANGSTAPLRGQVQPVWEVTTAPDPISPPNAKQPFELLLEVPLPALALVEVLLTPATPANAIPVIEPDEGVSAIANEFYTVTFDAQTGQLASATNQRTGLTSPLQQNIASYCPMGNNGSPGQPSGAYIFRPCTPNEVPRPFNTSFATCSIHGPLCSEVRQVIQQHNRIHQLLRVCKGQPHIQLISGIGALDPGTTGLEVVMRVQSDVLSNETWYTDSQGLELQRRVRNSRPNYDFAPTEPVASNFFPANTLALLNDTKGRNLAVLADRSRATASLRDGELEFLVLRRLLVDDGRGVDQPLNEASRLLSENRLIINSGDLFADVRRSSLLQAHPPLVRFGPQSAGMWQPFFQAAVGELPPNVHLHTRSLLRPNTLLVRLQHLFAAGEGPLAVAAEVDLRGILPSGMVVHRIIETDINGVHPLTTINTRRQQFRVCDAATGQTRLGPTALVSTLKAPLATLYPMEIRTYIVDFTF